MVHDTLPAILGHWAQHCPDKVWLKDLLPEGSRDITWGDAAADIAAMAAMLEHHFGHGERMVLLSRNCAHWFLADLAIISSGNITVSMFTTLPASTARYILDFTGASVVVVGETSNWAGVREVLPEGATLITLPGVDLEEPHLKWEELLAEWQGKKPSYQCQADDVMSLVFTSGTTGLPKGVIQTHATNIVPITRFQDAFGIRSEPRYFSYLPLSHIAERQIVEFSSIVSCGEVSFNQSLETLAADLQRVHPHMFFGPPRVWEQLKQAVIAGFGGNEALEQALAQNGEAIGAAVLAQLGLDEVEYCLVAAAPTPPALIHWWDRLGLTLMEGFGQTEAMGVICSSADRRRIGSIGMPVGDVEYRISEEGELLIRAGGCTPGYYKQPEKTAELVQDGWLYTGDKARVDEDGFIYLTGRVKDYFKTIQGKFVAPPPIEGEFAKNPHTEQHCLLGRGYSKTVMVAVLNEAARLRAEHEIGDVIQQMVHGINETLEKHARIGAVILTADTWTIENEVLTPTLKIRREKVEERFGELAEALARRSAEERELLLHWMERS
ncbi:AMP-binding protein [Kineobactrum sediminis]|uniref:AMP-binding protein n=1 Tax=Kineobactrum sediminis TaxID=1905677 RepID=A0A2N5Y1Q4_9GAMM|nr:AMP-binding protein [Kineobactrum sediminis]PLW82327.1 AMP-binding protein [Kineobactrum sediminis]